MGLTLRTLVWISIHRHHVKFQKRSLATFLAGLGYCLYQGGRVIDALREILFTTQTGLQHQQQDLQTNNAQATCRY